MHIQSAPQRGKKPAEELLARAIIHHQKGNLPKAEKYYRQALKVAPNHPDALHLSGLVAHQLGRHPRAIKLIKKAIERDQNQKVFHTNLSAIHIHLCNWEDASGFAKSAIALDETDGEAWGNLGQALAGLGQIDEALDALDRSLAVAPQNVQVLCNQATLLAAKERYNAAETACRTALTIKPDLPKAFHTLGIIQSKRGDFNNAINSFEQALKLEPFNGQTITNLATLYSSKARFNDAIKLFNEVLQINPKAVEAHYNLGVCYSEKGEMDLALSSFRKAIELDPTHVDAQYALATSGMVKLPPNHLTFLAELAHSSDLLLEDRAKLNFALGMQSDHQNLPAPAITFFAKGNTCRRILMESRKLIFDPHEHDRLAERICKVFQKSFFEERQGWGENTNTPVFVVGMPRSGTTLVEKILASHPEAFGAGERPNIPAIIKKLENNSGGDFSYPEGFETLEPSAIRALAEDDLNSMNEMGQGAARIVDKLPLNFLYLGLIAILYPNARIVHCRRDPRDTALSCYFQNFVHSHAWTCDLEYIGAYYKTYLKLMNHWHGVLPLVILDVNYEDIVRDQESKSREILGHIGLDWDPSCINFHSSEGAVRTASKWQVRQPIYTKSISRWRDYEAFLLPFTNALNR